MIGMFKKKKKGKKKRVRLEDKGDELCQRAQCREAGKPCSD